MIASDRFLSIKQLSVVEYFSCTVKIKFTCRLRHRLRTLGDKTETHCPRQPAETVLQETGEIRPSRVIRHMCKPETVLKVKYVQHFLEF